MLRCLKCGQKAAKEEKSLQKKYFASAKGTVP